MTVHERKDWDLRGLATLDGDTSLWKLFDFIATEEHHFNDLQARYRLLASAWLLASLSGIGFVIKEFTSTTQTPYLLIAGMAGAGALGIYLLWIMDMLVYHRLLDACFVEGLKLERNVREIPPFRHNMMRMQSNQGVLFRSFGFYMGPIALLTLIAGGALILDLRNEMPRLSIVLAITTTVLAYGEGFLIYWKTSNTADFEEVLAEDSRELAPRQPNSKPLGAALKEFVQAAPILVIAILICGGVLTWLAMNNSRTFVTVRLPESPNYLAPDKSEVRLLAEGTRGSMAHFTLGGGATSQAVAHRTVEETWYFLSGRGEMWRQLGAEEAVVEVSEGTSITIPAGTRFQFRSLGSEPLKAVAVTMPPWPGADEAVAVPGHW